MHAPKATIKRKKKTRMDMIRKSFEESCIKGCTGEWYRCTREILQYNIINTYVCSDAVKDLTRDRGKFRSIMIVGPANFEEKFMLKQLEHIYHVSCNPANDMYA